MLSAINLALQAILSTEKRMLGAVQSSSAAIVSCSTCGQANLGKAKHSKRVIAFKNGIWIFSENDTLWIRGKKRSC